MGSCWFMGAYFLMVGDGRITSIGKTAVDRASSCARPNGRVPHLCFRAANFSGNHHNHYLSGISRLEVSSGRLLSLQSQLFPRSLPEEVRHVAAFLIRRQEGDDDLPGAAELAA